MTRRRTPTQQEIDAAKRDRRYINALELRDSRSLVWRDNAACRDASPDAFFPEPAGPVEFPLRICAACPVQVACLADALNVDERDGIRGRTTPRERAPMLMAWHGVAPRASQKPATAPTVTLVIKCGTVVGAEAHWRRLEPICGPCEDALEAIRQAIA